MNAATMEMRMEATKKKKKHRIASHPILFAICITLLYIVFAGIMHAVDPLQGEVKDMVDSIAGAAMVVILVKLRFGKDFTLGIRKDGLKESLSLSSVVFTGTAIVFVMNLLIGQTLNTEPKALLTALCVGISAGVSEEIIDRAIICNNMMRVWKDKACGIYASVILSAVVFGLTHLVNAAVTGFTLGLLMQILFAVAIGVLFAAIYVRTKNIIGCIIAHALWDIGALLFNSGTSVDGMEALKENVNSVSVPGLIFQGLTILVALAVSCYMLRSSKHEEIKEHWNA